MYFKKGTLITIEGCDRSGKTTLISRLKISLAEQFPDKEIVATKEPGGTDLGLALYKLATQTQFASTRLFLMQAARVEHLNAVVRPALSRGAIVLCDRYIDSTVAYQHYGEGLDLNLVKHLNSVAVINTYPDLMIWLDIDPKTILSRLEDPKEFFDSDLELQMRVSSGFEKEMSASSYPKIAVDARRSPEAVHAEVFNTLKIFLKRLPGTPHPLVGGVVHVPTQTDVPRTKTRYTTGIPSPSTDCKV